MSFSLGGRQSDTGRGGVRSRLSCEEYDAGGGGQNRHLRRLGRGRPAGGVAEPGAYWAASGSSHPRRLEISLPAAWAVGMTLSKDFLIRPLGPATDRAAWIAPV